MTSNHYKSCTEWQIFLTREHFLLVWGNSALFSEQALIDEFHQFIPVIFADGNFMCAAGDLISGEGLDLIGGYNVGFMYPEEFSRRQLAFCRFDGSQGHVFALGRMDGDIVLGPFNKKDLCISDLFKAMALYAAYDDEW